MIYSESGKEFIDFFSGAGALNYGHNHDIMKKNILDYLTSDNIIHGLDMHTKAKREFIRKFKDLILEPRMLDYKIQFCGPTGTNAVEAALKLARKLTKRSGIFAFMGSFHGMSLGSLAVTSNIEKRLSSGVSMSDVNFFPYPEGCKFPFDTIEYIENILNDDHSGIEKPAAIIFETIQAEGGIYVASSEWIQKLRKLCDKQKIILICDDIQVGCGRTGSFFSFERAQIVPDIVVLSKSISGFGLPMSILLMKPGLDIWNPGEHNGTFRGNQLAFVGAATALEFWRNDDLEQLIKKSESFIYDYITNEILTIFPELVVRGSGMIWGIDFSNLKDTSLTQKIVDTCYSNGLIIEKAGREDCVLKLIPPINTEIDLLRKGCNIIRDAIGETIKNLNINKKRHLLLDTQIFDDMVINSENDSTHSMRVIK